LHEPSVPQVLGPESAHWFSGSVLAGMAVQTPRVLVSAQDMQIPVQEPAQQTPCWQEPDAHSALAAQSAPMTFLPQIVPLQTLPFEQSALVAHAALHVPVVPQVYGSQDSCIPGVQVPVPLQRPAWVAVMLVQVGLMHWVPEA
jgi:hypothetical protein